VPLTSPFGRLARVFVAIAAVLSLGAATALASTPTGLLALKTNPAVILQMHNVDHDAVPPAYLGMDIHAFVNVNGRAGEPTGTVKIYQWNGGSCSGAAAVVGPYTLSGSQVDTPYQWGMDTLGTFAFRANYLGDANYNALASACVVITVTKWPVNFHTELHNRFEAVVTETYVGETIHAAATLSGALGTPVGQVSVKHYLTGDCTGSPNYDVTVPAAADIDPAGPELYNNEYPGEYSWRLAYLGNTFYAAETGPCLKLVRKSSPTIAVTVHNPNHNSITQMTLGKTAHLRLAATGPFGTPTGDVTAKWYANGTCSGTAKSLGTRTLVNGVIDDTTLDLTPTKTGTYSFKALYPGDPSYFANDSSCVTLKIVAAPVVTPKPTSTPTPPAVTPQPTQVAVATPGPLASDVPAATDQPAESPAATPAPSAAPESTGAVPSAGPPATSGTPAASEGTGTTDPITPSGDGGSGTGWILLLGLILLLVLGAGYVYSRRTRRPTTA
jgi:LPXTG-motif cell wall-anchored protein